MLLLCFSVGVRHLKKVHSISKMFAGLEMVKANKKVGLKSERESAVGLSAFIVIPRKGYSQHVANFSHRDCVSIVLRLSARCTHSL